MLKTEALRLLGGAVNAAKLIGCTPSAIYMWPDDLPQIINDRVLAVQARRYLPGWVIGLGKKRAQEPLPFEPEDEPPPAG